MYLEVKPFVKEWKEQLKARIGNRKYKLDIIQIGDNEASNRYVRNKIKDCKEVGIIANLIKAETMTPKVLKDVLAQSEADGIMLQLPAPQELVDTFTQYVPLEKDVDGFVNPNVVPATALGIMRFLDSKIDLEGKDALVVGRSDIVGKPVAREFLKRNATVTVAHSKTRNLDEKLLDKQVIVAAVGKAGVIDATQCPAGSIVIDVGINFVEGSMRGDVVNGEEASAYVTPVPGGVGLLTRCGLLENVVLLAESQIKEVVTVDNLGEWIDNYESAVAKAVYGSE